ncbi:sperm acrosome membrane-associated protein 4-like [Trichomycterus rosablanca]|uniref:sperm acrosome membrane-associated protein 4-like n=1 Tax=Trichomycterus rosablanca TaxID=2290929 RepID=UPI002F358503
MNRTITGVLILALCLAAGHALQCYRCDLGLGSLCITTTTTCQASESCFSGKGSAASVIKFTQKGCVATADCNKTTSVNVPGINTATLYDMYKTCCSTDLCNAAMPLTNTLTLTIGSLVSLLLAKMLM